MSDFANKHREGITWVSSAGIAAYILRSLMNGVDNLVLHIRWYQEVDWGEVSWFLIKALFLAVAVVWLAGESLRRAHSLD